MTSLNICRHSDGYGFVMVTPTGFFFFFGKKKLELIRPQSGKKFGRWSPSTRESIINHTRVWFRHSHIHWKLFRKIIHLLSDFSSKMLKFHLYEVVDLQVVHELQLWRARLFYTSIEVVRHIFMSIKALHEF